MRRKHSVPVHQSDRPLTSLEAHEFYAVVREAVCNGLWVFVLMALAVGCALALAVGVLSAMLAA